MPYLPPELPLNQNNLPALSRELRVKKHFSRLFASRTFRYGVGLAFSALLLYFAVRAIGWQEVWITLRQADYRLVLLAVLSVGLTILLKTVRWRVLLSPQGNEVGFGRLLMALMTGQTLNWFLPGRVGEVNRVLAVGGRGPSRTFTLGSIALEKVLDLLSYALLFLYLILLLPLPDWVSSSGMTLIVLTVVLTAGVIVLSAYPETVARILRRLVGWLPERWGSQVLIWLDNGLASFGVLRRRVDLLKLALLSALVWGTAVWTNQLTAAALHIEIPWSASITVLVFLQAGISVPAIPGRIGIFQYLCILALGLFGVDQAMSFSYGILLQAIVLVPATLVSVPFFWFLGSHNRPVDRAAPGEEG